MVKDFLAHNNSSGSTMLRKQPQDHSSEIGTRLFKKNLHKSNLEFSGAISKFEELNVFDIIEPKIPILEFVQNIPT